MNRNILKSSNLKTTKHRLAILSVLENSHTAMTAEDIYSIVEKDTNMSLSTTYRILGALSEKGILLKNPGHDKKAYYQINSRRHKHQLVCSLCNDVVPIEDCPLTMLEKDLTEKTGFTITGHSLEFSGICPKCAGHTINKE